jgi:peptide/nickel transport system permease protein
MGVVLDKIKRCGIIRTIYGVLALLIILLMVISTCVIPGYDVKSATKVDYNSTAFQSPLGNHFLGTDKYGRDIFKQIVVGSRAFFVPSLIASGIALVFGTIAGSISGYYGGRSNIILSIATTFESMPRWILIFVVCAVSNANIYFIMITLGLTNFPKVANLINSRILQLKKEQFIEAAKELGLSDPRIVIKHLLQKNCKHILIGQGVHGIADAILVEITISFFFFSVGSEISWGKMLVKGQDFFFKLAENGSHPYWLWLFPALIITITISGFYVLGDVLTGYFETGE